MRLFLKISDNFKELSVLVWIDGQAASTVFADIQKTHLFLILIKMIYLY
jgi:hypothetical protein